MTELSFIDVLNDQHARAMVDTIEDTITSLRAYPEGDDELSSVLKHQIEALKNYNGFEYQI